MALRLAGIRLPQKIGKPSQRSGSSARPAGAQEGSFRGNVTTDSGIVTGHSGIVTGDSGHSRKSVTFVRKVRSRSAGKRGHLRPECLVTFVRKLRSRSPGKSGHVAPESSVTIVRNTHMRAIERARRLLWPHRTEDMRHCNSIGQGRAWRGKMPRETCINLCQMAVRSPCGGVRNSKKPSTWEALFAILSDSRPMRGGSVSLTRRCARRECRG